MEDLRLQREKKNRVPKWKRRRNQVRRKGLKGKLRKERNKITEQDLDYPLQ